MERYGEALGDYARALELNPRDAQSTMPAACSTCGLPPSPTRSMPTSMRVSSLIGLHPTTMPRVPPLADDVGRALTWLARAIALREDTGRWRLRNPTLPRFATTHGSPHWWAPPPGRRSEPGSRRSEPGSRRSEPGSRRSELGGRGSTGARSEPGSRSHRRHQCAAAALRVYTGLPAAGSLGSARQAPSERTGRE